MRDHLQRKIDRIKATDIDEIVERQRREHGSSAYAGAYGELSARFTEALNTIEWLVDEVQHLEKHLAERDQEAAEAAAHENGDGWF